MLKVYIEDEMLSKGINPLNSKVYSWEDSCDYNFEISPNYKHYSSNDIIEKICFTISNDETENFFGCTIQQAKEIISTLQEIINFIGDE